MMVSLASLKNFPVPFDDSNRNEIEIEKKVNMKSTLNGERNIDVIRTLATLLQDELLFDEKHILIESKSSSMILKEDSVTDRRNVLHFRNDNDDMIKYPLLRNISVNEMLTSITGSGSVCTLPAGGVMGGIIILPFEGSLCRPSSSVTSTHNTDKKPDRKAGRDFNDKQNMDSIDITNSDSHTIVMELDPVFAKGLSLVYSDADTPKDYITVLTVAYHTTDFKSVAKKSSVSIIDHINRSLNSSSSSTATESSSVNFTQNVFPSLQIRIPDSRCRNFPVPVSVIPGTALQSMDLKQESDHNREYLSTGDDREKIRLDVKGENLFPPFVYRTDELSRDELSKLAPPVDADDGTITTSVLYEMASDANKAEGGLFGFIIEEISTFLIRMFGQARKEVHKQEARNILYRNYFPKNSHSKSNKNDTRFPVKNVSYYQGSDADGDDGGIDCRAWVAPRELKQLLLFFIDHSYSTPLPFLHFLHNSMILFGRSASIFKYMLSTNGGITKDTMDKTFYELTDKKEDGMMLLINNLIQVFGDHCHCFFEDTNNNSNSNDSDDDSTNSIFNNVGRRSTSLQKVTDVTNDTIRIKQNISPKVSNFHIIISSSELPDVRGFCENNFAMHICIPLLMPYSFSHLGFPDSNNGNIDGSTKLEKKSKLKSSMKSSMTKNADISDTNKMSFFHLIESVNDTSCKKREDVTQSHTDNNQRCKEKFIGQIVDIIVFTISKIL